MSKQKRKTPVFHMAMIALAFIATTVAIIGGAYFRGGLDVTVGMYSTQRIRAPHVLANTRATERNRQAALERADNLELVYTIDQGEWQFVENNLQVLRGEIQRIREAYDAELAAHNQAILDWETTVENQNRDYSYAVDHWNTLEAAMIAEGGDLTTLPPRPEAPQPPPSPEWEGATFDMFGALPMTFSGQEQAMLMVLAYESLAMIWEAVNTVAQRIQTTREFSEVDFMTERDVQTALNDIQGLDRATELLVENIVLNHLRPNAIPNEAENARLHHQAAQNYEHVLVQYNQILVDEGEPITEDVYYLLAQFGMLRSTSVRENLIPVLGVIALVALLFVMCVMYLYFYRPAMAKKKDTLLLFTIYMLCLVSVWVLRGVTLPFLPLLPLLMFPFLVSLLLDRRCAVAIYPAMVFVCFFIAGGTLQFFMFYLPAGMLLCMFSRFTKERNKVLLVGILVSAALFVLAISTALIIERTHALSDMQAWIFGAGIAAANGMLTVIICTGSLPFWETLFGVVTPVRLLDLTNPTNPLLRRLTLEAPGTYHHSLIVANLAEKAAMDIGANAHIARAGAYYHDIGKLKQPHYFAENLDGDNPHNHMEPRESVKVLTGHVTHGLTLAAEHKLPPSIHDIIREHHGNTMQQFFYMKAKETDPQVDPEDFRYPYTIPQTKESACVMLADSVEAAVRATIRKAGSTDDLAETIRNIVRGKLNDNQLQESELSVRDVMTIERSFYRVLKGMYHERIVYPKDKA